MPVQDPAATAVAAIATAPKKNAAKKGPPAGKAKKKAPSVTAAISKPPKAVGRPQDRGTARPFSCQAEGCTKSYATRAGLHQHRRAKHPELIVPRGSHSSGVGRKFACPVDGCDKSYDSSAGLYQHKNHKHPELIRRRWM